MNHLIYFSQSQLLLAKTNIDQTTSRKAQYVLLHYTSYSYILAVWYYIPVTTLIDATGKFFSGFKLNIKYYPAALTYFGMVAACGIFDTSALNISLHLGWKKSKKIVIASVLFKSSYDWSHYRRDDYSPTVTVYDVTMVMLCTYLSMCKSCPLDP